jgi:hypothetical protein
MRRLQRGRRTLLLLLLGVSWSVDSVLAGKWSFADNVGLAVRKAGQACVSIHDASLRRNSRVQLVTTSPSQMVSLGRVATTVQSCWSAEVDDSSDFRHYQIRLATVRASELMPVIAISRFAGAFARNGDLMTADLDGDGRPEFFRSCTSAEGIHFTIWSGKPLSGTLRWHRYFHLGYDVVPTCTAAEVKSPN